MGYLENVKRSPPSSSTSLPIVTGLPPHFDSSAPRRPTSAARLSELYLNPFRYFCPPIVKSTTTGLPKLSGLPSVAFTILALTPSGVTCMGRRNCTPLGVEVPVGLLLRCRLIMFVSFPWFVGLSQGASERLAGTNTRRSHSSGFVSSQMNLLNACGCFASHAKHKSAESRIPER